MAPKYPQVNVQLVGEDGNALAIMGRVGKALKRAGVTRAKVNVFYREARAGDYDHLLQTVMEWVTVHAKKVEEEDEPVLDFPDAASHLDGAARYPWR